MEVAQMDSNVSATQALPKPTGAVLICAQIVDLVIVLTVSKGCFFILQLYRTFYPNILNSGNVEQDFTVTIVD